MSVLHVLQTHQLIYLHIQLQTYISSTELLFFSTGEAWPPQENSSTSSSPKSAERQLKSSSPWTYQDEGFNPALQPSNTAIRDATSTSRKRQRYNIAEGMDTYPVPPYHPDFAEGDNIRQSEDESDSSNDGKFAGHGKVRVRRGSEGYEVRPQNREDMLRRYLEELGEEPGRYLRYIPQPDDASEDEDDNIPLAFQAAAQAEMANGIGTP